MPSPPGGVMLPGPQGLVVEYEGDQEHTDLEIQIPPVVAAAASAALALEAAERAEAAAALASNDVPAHEAAPNPHPQYARPFVYTQPTPAGQWTVNHNLGYRPAVAVFDSGSQEVIADVAHLSVNTTVITFTIPTAGFTRLI